MDVDAKSESESEDEVRTCCIISSQPRHSNLLRRRRNSTLPVRWNSWKRAGAWQSSPSPGWTSLLLLRLLPRCLPRSPSVRLPYRAQERVAQQKLDSRLPLSRIIDIRKRVFADVKVRSTCPVPYPHSLDRHEDIFESWLPNWG